jgi:micrococcal nuclease
MVLRRFGWIVAGLLGLLLSGHLALAQVSPTAPATVVRVVDGDTVDVRFDDGATERLRLIGIDTPEVVDPRKPVECFGREASQYAHGLLDGQRVSIEKDASQGDRDRYGRLLAYIWLPERRNVGSVMIGDGYADEYTYRTPYVYQDEFKALQRDAMNNQLGLWSPSTCAGDTLQPADQGGATPTTESTVLQSQPAGQAGTAPTSTVPAQAFDPTRYLGQGDRYNCSAFVSQADAQAVLRADPSDPNRLDADGDGIACESNPPPRDLVPVARP